MKSSLIVFAGLFVFSFLLTPQVSDDNRLLEHELPELKKTKEIIQETELYQRLEELEYKMQIAEDENNRRLVKKPHGEVLSKISDNNGYIPYVRDSMYYNDSIGNSNRYRE